jgi:hypothetical protein
MHGWKKYLLLVASALVVAPACGSDTEGNNASNSGNGGKGDEVNNEVANDPAFDAPLTMAIVNASGRAVDPEALRDPIAKFILRNEGEPATYRDLVEKLDEHDNTDCDSGFGSNEAAKMVMESYVVSETAQREESVAGNSYRVVVSRECDSRDRADLFFSIFGVGATTDEPTSAPEDWNEPPNAEIMAFDEVAGVYNYYEVSRGEIEFFGDSKDFINGEGGRCSACHTGGGPIMKELDTPWVHWEGHLDIPGAQELVDARPALYGKKASGSTLERLVKDGNRKWNGFRLQHLIEQNDTAKALEPLFCSVEVNLDNGTDFKDRDLTRINSDFLLDPQLRGSSVSVTEEQYQVAIDEVGQFVAGVDGDFNDTIFTFTYPERAHADNDFVQKLESAGIVDENFIKDVIMVDFTRPIFSDARCGLLRFAPDVDLAQATDDSANAASNNASTGANAESPASLVDQVRDGFIVNLQAASPAEGTPEARFLAHLENLDDNQTHNDAVTAYIDACKARDGQEFMTDAVKVAVAYRNVAALLPVFEFPATMPQATMNIDPELRFNPTTCVAE